MYGEDMQNTTWTPLLAILGVSLLVTSCAGDAQSTDSAVASTPSEEAESVAASEEPDVEDIEIESDSVPLSEEHLAEGVEMPECLAGENDIYVQSGVDLEEAELADLCPAEPADDRQFRPSQQIMAVESDVELQYLPGEDGAGTEVHHLHCEDPDALAEKEAHNNGSQPVGWPQEWDGTGAMPDPYCHPDYLEIGEWEHLQTHTACWEGIETSTLADGGQPQDEINDFLWEQSQARADWQPNPPGGTCAEQWAEHEGSDPEDYADIGNADDG